MKLTHYIKNLCFILWNMIAFLCPIISLKTVEIKQKHIFSLFVVVYRYLTANYKILKAFINIKILKNKNNNTAGTPAALNYTNKNNISKLNRVIDSCTLANKALKSFKLFYIKRLKDALATQNLISKHYFIRLWDKCAFLYPFCKQKSLQSINL